MTLRWIAAIAAMGGLVFGCGSDQAADIAAASKAVKEQRDAVAVAQDAVSERAAEVADAQKLLASAQDDLRAAEAELVRREAAVDARATDTVVFREVQKRLLEDDELSRVAISASVKDSVVTLNGSVENGMLRDRAVEVSRDTPGVDRVDSRIEVQVSAPPPAE